VVSPEPLYRPSLRNRFLLVWTANLYARLRSVVEIVRPEEIAHFVPIRATDGGCTLQEVPEIHDPAGLIEPKTG
jgi:hypothetical protein